MSNAACRKKLNFGSFMLRKDAESEIHFAAELDRTAEIRKMRYSVSVAEKVHEAPDRIC